MNILTKFIEDQLKILTFEQIDKHWKNADTFFSIGTSSAITYKNLRVYTSTTWFQM
jgi:hypothetical protein